VTDLPVARSRQGVHYGSERCRRSINALLSGFKSRLIVPPRFSGSLHGVATRADPDPQGLHRPIWPPLGPVLRQPKLARNVRARCRLTVRARSAIPISSMMPFRTLSTPFATRPGATYHVLGPMVIPAESRIRRATVARRAPASRDSRRIGLPTRKRQSAFDAIKVDASPRRRLITGGSWS
jgi:hypothetical protein